ncbi:MAG: ferritin-like domain-containing protein [Acidobacteria bacterium]|nr:ferritin-like domain-containing protein [Acidobacteriota bacterium]
MAIKTLQEKFTHGLGDIYDAEHRFLEAQQKMLPSATAETVITALETHITETEEQIENLKQVFELLGLSAKRVSCDGAAGIVSEGNKLLKETSDVPTLADLAIVGGCSKVEHYEIASYRGLISAAETMGQADVVKLLTKNLQQEEKTAQTLEQSMPMLLKQAAQSATATA